MPSLFAYLAPVALLVPFGLSSQVPAERASDARQLDPSELERLAEPGKVSRERWLSEAEQVPLLAQYQVRIERRVTVRIVPRSAATRQSLMADLPQEPSAPRYVERKMDSCVPVGDIAGVQTGGGNQLVLFLRDRRMVSARLEKACRARDFYSGFYLERNDDGKLCVDRDKLQSRAGANCELSQMRELVPVYD